MRPEVLIIDDEWAVSRAISARLEASGFEVRTAVNGLDGLAAIEASRPDAVLLVDYPGLNRHLMRIARRLGVPTVQFVAPQLWAWAPWRVRDFRRADRLCRLRSAKVSHLGNHIAACGIINIKGCATFAIHPVPCQIPFGDQKAWILEQACQICRIVEHFYLPKKFAGLLKAFLQLFVQIRRDKIWKAWTMPMPMAPISQTQLNTLRDGPPRLKRFDVT